VEEAVDHACVPAVVLHLLVVVVDLVEQWYFREVVAWHFGMEPVRLVVDRRSVHWM